MAFTAIVFGGTGATGSALVRELASRPEWGTVLVPVRGDGDAAADLAALDGVRVLRRADYANLAACLDGKGSGSPPPPPPVDAAFICLGTTRSAAGTAAAFLAADVAAPVAAARFATAPPWSARHLALVSAAGAARGGAWAPTARPLHGLLYRAAKGQAEEGVLAAGAPSTSIFRPGLLDRGPAFAAGRWVERAAAAVLPGLPVADLARAMVVDAVAQLTGRGGGGSGGSGGSGGGGERVWSDSEVRTMAAASG